LALFTRLYKDAGQQNIKLFKNACASEKSFQGKSHAPPAFLIFSS